MALYEVTSDTPAATDDDYLTRRRIMNRALHTWERNKGFWWNALWSTTSAQSIVAGQQTYTTPVDFRRAGGFVDVMNGTTRLRRYPVVSPNDVRTATQDVAYFTGSPNTGYTLNLKNPPTPDLYGHTISYDYYKKVTEYTDPTIISEIPDPEYIVHYTVAQLWKGDRKMNAYQSSMEDAIECLKGMEVAAVANIDWQSFDANDETEGFGY